MYLQQRVESDLRPLCGLESETMEHVCRCKCHSATENREGTLKIFWQNLRKAGTAPEITNCWMEQLHLMMGAGPFAPSFIHDTAHHRQMASAVAVARRHQAVLGWNGFLQGRISKEWGKVQRLHEKVTWCSRGGLAS